MYKLALRFTCAAIIFGSFMVNLYEYFVLAPRRLQTFVISPLSLVNGYFLRPAFWACIGILLASFLLQPASYKQEIRKLHKQCMWIGTVITILYAALAALVLAVGSMGVTSDIVLWLSDNTPVFLIPGILIGVGAGRENR